MYKRHKILLAVLERFGRTLSSTDMQKLLFLLSEEFSLKAYDFVPYKYGCFSFQAYADKRKLTKDGFLTVSDSEWQFAQDGKVPSFNLSFEENHKINMLYRKYSSLKGNELVRYVYVKYPYYAIRSEIAGQILNSSEMAELDKARPTNTKMVLYTIGYEGKSLESYINILLREDVQVLCDIRRNPLSMKYGFSKTTLKKAIESVGIEYVHIPELGIESDKRKNLNSSEDYKALFIEYEKGLEKRKPFISQIEFALLNKKRIALTCFEANPESCHRTIVAKALRSSPAFAFDYKEL